MKFDVDKVQYDFINKWFFYPDTIEEQIIVQEIAVDNAVGELKAIQSLKEKVERKYEKDNGKLAEVMEMPVKKNQCQESVEPIRDNHLLFHERQQELRTKALNLAITFVISNKPEHAIETAKRFYTYITKGE